METINWSDFEKVKLKVGTIISAEDFPKARKPAYKVTINFGAFDIKKLRVQITALYKKEELIGRQIVEIINFPLKQIGPFVSECLITGFADKNGNVVITEPKHKAPNDSKIF